MYKRERGQSLVEFALSLALLIRILLAIFDLGRAFNADIIVANAAREGAYYGAMHPEDSGGIVAHAMQEAQGSGITPTAVSVSTSGVSGTPLSVTVEYDFSLLSSFLPVTSIIHLRRSAEMVIY